MSARRWLEILGDDLTLEAVSTLDDFRKANADTFDAADLADLHALGEGLRLGVGGGAAPLVFVRWMPKAQADKLDEIERLLGEVDVEQIEIQRDEEAPLLWSIWSLKGEDIMGASETFDGALDEALAQARAWAAPVNRETR